MRVHIKRRQQLIMPIGAQTPRRSTASFIAVALTSAVITSLVLDHFGWLGFDVRPATAGGMAGGALMIVGVVMIATL